MKKITDDLVIAECIVSMYGKLKGAELTFMFLDRYLAKAIYYENSTGNSWFETNGESSKVHDSFTAEVEENEKEIIKWVNSQIKLEFDKPNTPPIHPSRLDGTIRTLTGKKFDFHLSF